MKALLRDRLVWFVLGGLVLFAADGVHRAARERLIVIDLPLVEKLAAQWQAQTKRQASPEEIDALIEGYIREEILVREAERWGLDADDVIIRRRLAQKVEFFLGDNSAPTTPTEVQLKGFYELHQESYRIPETVSFEHVFSGAKKPDAKLREALKKQPQNWQNLGQPFMLSRAYASESKSDLAQLMGGDFAESVFGIKSRHKWVGPFRSAYGWHMVRVKAREAATQPPFAQLAEKLARDWQEAELQKTRDAAWRDLRRQYRVEILPVEVAQ